MAMDRVDTMNYDISQNMTLLAGILKRIQNFKSTLILRGNIQ